MENNEMERAIEDAVEEAARSNVRPINNASFSDKLAKYEEFGVALRRQMERDSLDLEHNYRQQALDIAISHERAVAEAITRLEAERDRDLSDLRRKFEEKSREVALALKRMG